MAYRKFKVRDELNPLVRMIPETDVLHANGRGICIVDDESQINSITARNCGIIIHQGDSSIEYDKDGNLTIDCSQSSMTMVFNNNIVT